jgi:hypothetical protein
MKVREVCDGAAIVILNDTTTVNILREFLSAMNIPSSINIQTSVEGGITGKFQFDMDKYNDVLKKLKLVRK